MAAGSLLPAAARRLQGKVAVITGGATGIGETTARLFTKHGAKVVIADIRDDLAEGLCKDLGLDNPHNPSSFIHCDVANESHVKNAIDTALHKHGRLDIMVNNAAIGDPPRTSILDNTKEDFDKVIAVNLTGAFLGIKHAARAMIPGSKGSIINIGSVCSSVGGVASHACTSSKHALVGLTRNVAAELGPYGIRVNCLSPYFILTPLTRKFFNMDEDDTHRIYSNLQGISLRQDDVAQAALYLGSDDSQYVSGHNLAIDGGFTTINPAFGLHARL